LSDSVYTVTHVKRKSKAVYWVYQFNIKVPTNERLPSDIQLRDLQVGRTLIRHKIQDNPSWSNHSGAYKDTASCNVISYDGTMIHLDAAFQKDCVAHPMRKPSILLQKGVASTVLPSTRYPYKTFQTIINVLTVTAALACTMTAAMLFLWSMVTLMVSGAIVAALIAISLSLNTHQLYHAATARIILSVLCKTVSFIMIGLLLLTTYNVIPFFVGLGFTIACVVLTTTAGCLDRSTSVLSKL
jgi:hypothetical protein